MISRRIRLIASLLDKNDRVLDIGTDHALLPIYLCENDLVTLVDASDVSEHVLQGAKKNIEKYGFQDKINLYLSDGLNDIDVKKYNTLVICGMGYFTIKDILNCDLNNINKLIVQTNNHLSDFRKYIISIGFRINKEFYISDKGIDYIIFDLIKGEQELSLEEINCGIYNSENTLYYKNQINKLSEILKSIPSDNTKKRNELELLISTYNKYIIKDKTEEE